VEDHLDNRVPLQTLTQEREHLFFACFGRDNFGRPAEDKSQTQKQTRDSRHRSYSPAPDSKRLGLNTQTLLQFPVKAAQEDVIVAVGTEFNPAEHPFQKSLQLFLIASIVGMHRLFLVDRIQLFQEFPQSSTGPKSADFDIGFRPADCGSDLFDGATLAIEKMQHQAVLRSDSLEHAADQLPGNQMTHEAGLRVRFFLKELPLQPLLFGLDEIGL
jgi:hypothetical protein